MIKIKFAKQPEVPSALSHLTCKNFKNVRDHGRGTSHSFDLYEGKIKIGKFYFPSYYTATVDFASIEGENAFQRLFDDADFKKLCVECCREKGVFKDITLETLDRQLCVVTIYDIFVEYNFELRQLKKADKYLMFRSAGTIVKVSWTKRSLTDFPSEFIEKEIQENLLELKPTGDDGLLNTPEQLKALGVQFSQI